MKRVLSVALLLSLLVITCLAEDEKCTLDQHIPFGVIVAANKEEISVPIYTTNGEQNTMYQAVPGTICQILNSDLDAGLYQVRFFTNNGELIGNLDEKHLIQMTVSDMILAMSESETAEYMQLFLVTSPIEEIGIPESPGTVISASVLYTTKPSRRTPALVPAPATPKPTGSATVQVRATPTPTPAATARTYTYILNTSTKKFHYSSCGSVKTMKARNKRSYTGTRQQVISMGYSPCQKCKP